MIGGPVASDVARAVGFRPTLEGSEQLYLASKMVLDSRADGAPHPMASIIGKPIEDLDAIRRLVGRAKALGYSGILLIHPSHVAVANEAFTPTREEIEYYSGLVAAFRTAEQSGSAAIRYRGAMVDYAMVLYAEALLREGKRRGLLAN